MPRPRLTDKEYELFLKIKDNDFIIDQISALEQECKRVGIDVKDVRHYWYKSKKFSLFAKNKVMTYEQVKDKLIEELNDYSPDYKHISREPLSNPHLLVIDPSDIHVGKLAVAVETGEDYNIEKAVNRVAEGIEGIIQKAAGFPIEKVLFIIGNDALHIDSPFRKTTAGTPQDTDGMWHSAFLAAKDMYVKAIERSRMIANTHVLYCPSNHDFQQGFFLADTLMSWFRKTDQVTFDVSPAHRKYFQYFLNMIEADHGDGCKEKETPMLMAQEAPQIWADTLYRYSYKHHVHHHKSLDLTGANITAVRSPSPPDGWHDRNGFLNMPAIEGFVHGQTTGRVAHLTHYFMR